MYPNGVLGHVDVQLGVDGLDHIGSGSQIILKRLLEELVGGCLHQLDQVWAECITIFLKETYNVPEIIGPQ